MVVRRKQDHKEEKEKVRRALLAATLRLAAPYGFASLSLREVAREAGIAPTSFYRHFEAEVPPFSAKRSFACCIRRWWPASSSSPPPPTRPRFDSSAIRRKSSRPETGGYGVAVG
jgi:Bacterial regulatory proteins, tetR family